MKTPPHAHQLPEMPAFETQPLGEPNIDPAVVHHSILGRGAVINAQLAEDMVAKSDSMQRGEIPYDQDFEPSDYHEIETEMSVNEARAFFLTLDGEQRVTTQHHLSRILAGTEFEPMADNLTGDKENHDWVELLGKNFDDDQMLDFLHWNVARTAEAQEILNESVEQYKAEFISRIQDAVSNGRLPQSASVNLSQLDNVEFYAGDVFGTLGRLDARGCYLPLEGGGTILISAEMLLSGADIEKLITHEMVHAIAGRSANGVKTGMRYDLHNAWLDEAMTEHIAQSLLGSTHFDRPYPFKRKQDSDTPQRYGSYVEEREVFTILAPHADLEKLLGLYFGYNEEPLEKLNRLSQDIFGSRQAYFDAMKRYGCATNRIQRARAMEDLTIQVARKLRLVETATDRVA